ncbi:hypothetical protein [Streptomyces sp. A5-4]|uniref:hypothetical protein n=1 Tax=Streptomyces sp. A5-4 TaxID=3384771 RepID=UPI003DA863E9
MSVRDEVKAPSQLEQDAVEVLVWLVHNAGREVSYADIARGVGIADGSRLRRALPKARVAASLMGHRLEQFMTSRDPLRRRASVTRLSLSGRGDEFSARDAVFSTRKALSAMSDMERSCTFEAHNAHGIAPQAFGQMATTVGGCIAAVSGVEELGQQVYRQQGKINTQAQRIADLEAQLAEVSTQTSSATS